MEMRPSAAQRPPSTTSTIKMTDYHTSQTLIDKARTMSLETMSPLRQRHKCTELQEAIYSPQKVRKRVPILLPELWAEIFCYFKTEAPDSRTKYSIFGPLLLTHVCTEWRAIALSTPTLWTDIRIIICKFRPSDAAMKLLELWLERSRSALLRVHLLEHNGLSWAKPIDPIDRLDSLSLRVLKESYRWEKFHLETHSPPGTLSAFESIRNNIPLLRECEISYHRDIKFASDLQTINLFHGAPSLRSFATNYPPLFFRMEIPFCQLRNVDLLRVPFSSERLPIDSCLKVLSICANLTCLGINCDASLVETSHIVHNALEELSIAFSAESKERNADLFSNFLGNLTAPALTQFVYIGRIWDNNAFTQFIKRTPRLEMLHLWCDAISGEEIFNNIHHITNIKKLYFTSSQKSVEFLVDKLSTADAWPHLLGDLKYVAGDSMHVILPSDYNYQFAAGARMKIRKLTRLSTIS